MCLFFLWMSPGGGNGTTASGVTGGGVGGGEEGDVLPEVSLLGAGEDQRLHPMVSVSCRAREGAPCCSIERLGKLAVM